MQLQNANVKLSLDRPAMLYKKRKMYSHLVQEKFKPKTSEVNKEKTLY